MIRQHIMSCALMGALLIAPVGCAPGVGDPASLRQPETLSQRSQSDQTKGDQAHPEIIQKFGGVYENAKLANYVNMIGRKIASVSEQPNAKWTFTVLDTPTVNAFALPGGYVYVTRGLVALANDEAELAGVIGHEIGHVTAGHSGLREDRAMVASGLTLLGQIGLAVLGVDPNLAGGISQIGQAAASGVLASYSRADELAADNLGIRYIARAGYDPYAQADFLESMNASSALQARLAGQGYNAESVDFFASHPATGPRTRQAIQVAQNAGEKIPVGASRQRDKFLGVIDGMIYGDAADQGLIRGNTFMHPKLGFRFSVPAGYELENTPSAVLARGPNDALFLFDGASNPSGSLSNYVINDWVPSLAKNARISQPSNPQSRKVNGLDAASTTFQMQTNNGVYDVFLLAIRLDGALYRISTRAPRGSGALSGLERAATSFERLSRSEANSVKQAHIDVVTVQSGDTVASLARRMAVPSLPEQQFMVLNGLKSNADLKAGMKVKLIR